MQFVQSGNIEWERLCRSLFITILSKQRDKDDYPQMLVGTEAVLAENVDTLVGLIDDGLKTEYLNSAGRHKYHSDPENDPCP